MINVDREELINKSLSFRVFQKDNMLFVNMVAVTRCYSFVCKIEDLDKELDVPALKDHAILNSYMVDGVEMETDAYFVKIYWKNNHFYGELSDGTIIEDTVNCSLDYDCIVPTKEEYKKLIMASIEEF